MSKDTRLRNAALILLLTVIMYVVLSNKGVKFMSILIDAIVGTQNANSGSSNPTGNFQILIGLISIAFVFFASDAIGLLINSIMLPASNLFYNIRHSRFNRIFGSFYDSEWARFDANLRYKNRISNAISKNLQNRSAEGTFYNANKLERISEDVFFSYFWQRGDARLVEWVSNRYAAFFTYANALTGLALGTAIGLTIVIGFNMSWSLANSVTVAASVIVGYLLYRCCAAPRAEARYFIELWLVLTISNDTIFRGIINDIEKLMRRDVNNIKTENKGARKLWHRKKAN